MNASLTVGYTMVAGGTREHRTWPFLVCLKKTAENTDVQLLTTLEQFILITTVWMCHVSQ